MTRIALLQMTAGTDPARNAATLADAARGAAGKDAAMLFTPEMSGFLNRNRAEGAATIRQEDGDIVLAAARSSARDCQLWIALGSLAIDRGDGAWANRSFVIAPDGSIRARYDKMHMFDVDLASGESWRESNAYRAGDEVVAVAGSPVGTLGLSICYDLRFPALYEALGQRTCDVIAIPAAFTVPTGQAHWHISSGRARSKPVRSSSRQHRSASTRMAARPTATASLSIPGAKSSSTWVARRQVSVSRTSISRASQTCARRFPALPTAVKSPLKPR